jgi:hypothetical protein
MTPHEPLSRPPDGAVRGVQRNRSTRTQYDDAIRLSVGGPCHDSGRASPSSRGASHIFALIKGAWDHTQRRVKVGPLSHVNYHVLKGRVQNMGNYLIALVYSLAAIALVGVAVVTDSLKRSHSFQPLTASATQSRDKSAELQGIIESNLEFGIFAVDKNQHASLSADNSTKNSSGFEPLEFAKQLVDNVFQKRQENFTFDPKSEQSKYPEWIPAEIRNGWIFLATALLLSLAATVFILGPERIQKKWNRWVTWYEHSEHVRVGLLYPQLPIHIANGVFSVVSPIFILRVLQVSARDQMAPKFAARHWPSLSQGSPPSIAFSSLLSTHSHKFFVPVTLDSLAARFCPPGCVRLRRARSPGQISRGHSSQQPMCVTAISCSIESLRESCESVCERAPSL